MIWKGLTSDKIKIDIWLETLRFCQIKWNLNCYFVWQKVLLCLTKSFSFSDKLYCRFHFVWQNFIYVRQNLCWFFMMTDDIWWFLQIGLKWHHMQLIKIETNLNFWFIQFNKNSSTRNVKDTFQITKSKCTISSFGSATTTSLSSSSTLMVVRRVIAHNLSLPWWMQASNNLLVKFLNLILG